MNEEKIDRAESSRRNGAKSQGPTTPEGKRTSSQNSLKHGFYARRIPALTTEEQQELDQLRDKYLAEWRPTGQRQSDLVEILIDSQWRYVRFAAMEKWLVESMMSQMRSDVAASYNGEPNPDLRCALAYERLYEKNRALENFQRERQRLVRIIDRSTRLLKDLQDQNPPAASDDDTTQICGNEPEIGPKSDPRPAENRQSDLAPASETAKIWSPAVCLKQTEPPEVTFAMAA